MKVKSGLASLAMALLCACGSPSGPSAIGDGWLDVGEETWCFIPHAETNCLGFHGFVVARDGNFSAGHVVSGRISPGELSALRNDVALLDASFRKECDSQGGHSDYQDVVHLSLRDRTLVQLYSFSEGCYRGGRDHARRVKDDVRALMEKYYPIPFPGL